MARIAHLTTAHGRYDVRIFLKECRSLAQGGHDVTLMVADGKPEEWRDGVRIVSVPASRGRLGRMGAGTLRVLLGAASLGADVYHLHDPELLLAGLVLKAWGAKVVFDSHEDIPKQVLSKDYLPLAVRRAVSAFAASLIRVVLPPYSGLVAATPIIRDELRKVHPNPVDISNYPILGELSVAPRGGAPSRHVCYIGNISRIRGIVSMVAAMERLPADIRLHLAGTFEDPGLEAEVRAMKGWEHVDYHGMVGRGEVARLMAESAAGLVTLLPVPNYLEAQPIKMYEYMSAGLAVIGSDFPYWRTTLDDGPCGLGVDPEAPGAIAAAILDLVSSPERAEAMGRNGQRLVRERLNWQAEGVRLCDYYRKLLASPHS